MMMGFKTIYIYYKDKKVEFENKVVHTLCASLVDYFKILLQICTKYDNFFKETNYFSGLSLLLAKIDSFKLTFLYLVRVFFRVWAQSEPNKGKARSFSCLV